MRIIDADALKERAIRVSTVKDRCYMKAVGTHEIDKAPTVDAVSKGLFDQIKWERDIAIGQLREIDCQLGQKMDGVKAKLEAVPVVHGRWAFGGDGIVECTKCGETYDANMLPRNFCPNCGADMREYNEVD